MSTRVKKRRDSKVLSLPVRSDDTWMTLEDGQLVPPLRIRRFLEWYMDPERTAGTSLLDWSRENEVNVNTVRAWLRDARFIKILDQRCAELNLRPDRTQAVIEAMWKRAVEGNVAAATLYLQHIGKLQPVRQQIDVNVVHSIRDLPTEQLQAEVARVMKALPAGVIDAEIVEEGA